MDRSKIYDKIMEKREWENELNYVQFSYNK